MKRYLLLSSLLVAALFNPLNASDLNPEKVGLSSERLKRIDTLIDSKIQDNIIAGAVVLVARKGEIAYFRAAGKADVAKEMKKDTMFRIVSMTKPLVSVCIMTLYEEGKLLLSDPVSKYIPEFKNQKVLVEVPEGSGTGYKLVPVNRDMTIKDLLTHTSGLLYLFPAEYFFDEKRKILVDMYKEAEINDGYCPLDEEVGDMVKRLGSLPLYAQPGEHWDYSIASDVLGYLVEVVSGMKFDEYMKKKIFDPLKMKDSYFYVPEEKRDRLSAVWLSDGKGTLKRVGKEPIINGHLALCPANFISDGKYLSGGGGVVSTVYDYYRFAQMLLNGGELDGARVLSRKTVELMTATNHIGDIEADFLHSEGWKFGLGFAIEEDRGHDVDSGSVGTFEWAGLYSTRFSVDPKEQKVTIFMSQTSPFNVHFELWDKLLVLSSTAIVD